MSTAHEWDDAEARNEYLLGELRAIIARRKLRQTALAARIGMHQQHLSSRLNGGTPFKLVELIRLADALDMPLTDLVRLADPPPAVSARGDSSGWYERHHVLLRRYLARARDTAARPLSLPDQRVAEAHLAAFPAPRPANIVDLRPTGT